MKTVFWHEGHSKISVAPCPFMGVKVNSLEEFVEKVLFARLFRPVEPGYDKGTYPPVVFSTKDRRFDLCFRGSYPANAGIIPINSETGEQYKWWLWDTEKMQPVKFFAREQLEEIMELFPDSEVIDKRAEEISKLIEKNGGIYIKL